MCEYKKSVNVVFVISMCSVRFFLSLITLSMAVGVLRFIHRYINLGLRHHNLTPSPELNLRYSHPHTKTKIRYPLIPITTHFHSHMIEINPLPLPTHSTAEPKSETEPWLYISSSRHTCSGCIFSTSLENHPPRTPFRSAQKRNVGIQTVDHSDILTQKNNTTFHSRSCSALKKVGGV